MKTLISGLLALLLSACSTTGSNTPPPVFEGETLADAKLKRDTLEMAQMFTAANGCSNIESVSASVTFPPSGELGKERTEEQWILKGCGKTYPFKVTFTGDGQGGAYFNLGRQF